MDFKLQEGEKIIKQGSANLSNIVNSKGGKLYLTNQRLIFIGHGMNIGNDAYAVNVESIMSARKSSTVSIFLLCIPVPNAIRVVTNNGVATKFTVSGRDKWIKAIGDVVKVV